MRLINKDRELKLRNKADSASTIIIYTLGVLEPDQTCGHISQHMRLKAGSEIAPSWSPMRRKI